VIIFPAIDLKDGKCVRLYQGKMEKVTVFSDNPVDMALKWQEKGATYLHLIDLNGAFAGSPQNARVISQIVQSLTIPIQVGGGVRNMETIDRLLGEGVARVIIGTSAVTNPQLIEKACAKYGEQIVLGLDAKDGLVAIDGWEKESTKNFLDLAYEMKELGIQRIIFTDTSLDGTLKGPNLTSTKELAEKTGLKIIASGGVSSLDDIKNILELEKSGVEGVIVGIALYRGNFKLEEALALAQRGS
jgi:phosphoribosylformimino-5-aminoimidazole carboxamide ribotide isomerase